MKNSIKNGTLFLAGIAFVGFMFTAASMGGDKPAGKPWAAPDKDAKMAAPMKADEATLATGKEVWNQHCKSCHGKTGKGDGPKAENIEISCGDFTSADYTKQSDGALYYKTTEGRKPMPSFKQKLSDTERLAVTLYSKTFAK